MADNQLVPKKSFLPVVRRDSTESKSVALVKYERIDQSHYSFTYNFDEDVTFQMNESDQNVDHTDFVEAEYVENVPESHKIYYSAAAASGIITGTLCMLHLKEEQLKEIDDFKEKDWKPLIINAANLAGYQKNDYKGASKYLVTRAVRTIESQDNTKECLAILAEHPSLAGLAFSIITQYSGKAIVVSESGEISKHELPSYYVIGETNPEKIICGVFYWLFSIAADEADSKRRVIDELGISKEILKKIKEFASFKFMKNIPENYAEAEEAFSKWLEKTIHGAELYRKNDNSNEKTNLLFGMMKFALNIAEDSFPVLINEGIVHSLYILIRLCSEVSEKAITSFEELLTIPVDSLLPSDGRLLSRMCLIASAAFSAANVAGATLKALKSKKVNGKGFRSTFLAELNIAGVGRLLFACAADSKYWGEDIRVRLQRNSHAQNKKTAAAGPDINDGEAFDSLVLDAIQARILYSLESISVQYDIQRTEKLDVAEKKILWWNNWKNIIVEGIELTPDLAAQYFVEDEDVLYNGIFKLAQDKSNWKWFYLLTQELALFEPYIPLGSEDDKEYKKLKVCSDYVTDQFVRRQTIVTQSEVDAINKAYSKYKGYISGSTQKKVVGAGATAVIAVATGGVALTFAPGIAAAIAGEAVAGLHGAALTSASLAFVGGGSLAAGGLGMAGGTAIITGGGALIGLAGSGSISAATVLLQTPSEYWVRQSAKLLTYSDCILSENLHDIKAIQNILAQVELAASKTEKELDELNAEKNDLDKELIKRMEMYLKYLKKSCSALQKLIKE